MEQEKLGEFEILAAEPWNHTGLRLEAGHTYRMSATGEWFDRGLPYGPEGGPAQSPIQRIFEWARRQPHQPWFVLIGAIDADNGTAFRIGKELASFTTEESGELPATRTTCDSLTATTRAAFYSPSGVLVERTR